MSFVRCLDGFPPTTLYTPRRNRKESVTKYLDGTHTKTTEETFRYPFFSKRYPCFSKGVDPYYWY